MREGLRSVVVTLTPVAQLPMAAAGHPAGPGPTVRCQIHWLPSLAPTDLQERRKGLYARLHDGPRVRQG